MKNPKVLIVFITFLILEIPLLYYSNRDNFIATKDTLNQEDNLEEKIMESAWSEEPFTIDDTGGGDYNWTEALAEPWCTGQGTFNNPYIIDNINFNSATLSAYLEVKNSNAYFIIQNCIFTASVTLGIKLQSAHNGTIINNQITDGGHMQIWSSNNITISGNTINNANSDGLVLAGVFDSIVSDNTITSSDRFGILLNTCENNTVTKNSVSFNRMEGITFATLGPCNYINVSFNIVSNNGNDGLYVNGNYNNIHGNTFSSNSGEGMRMLNSQYCNISNNRAEQNNRNGLNIGGNNITLYNNTALNNRWWGITAGSGGGSNIVSYNKVTGGGFSIGGTIQVNGTTNTVNDGKLYYYLDKVGLSNKNFTNSGQAILYNCNDSVIFNTTGGVFLSYCNNISVIRNNVSHLYKGIYTFNSNKNNYSFNSVDNTDDGIYIHGDNNYIGTNTVLNSETGVYVVGDNNNLTFNTINNTIKGLHLVFSEYNNITSNKFYNNTEFSIYLENSNDNSISGNLMYECGLGFYIGGESLNDMRSYNISTSNLVNDKTLYYYKDKKNLNDLNFTNAGQIILVNCSYSKISNQNASITLNYSDYNNITSNAVREHFYYGIRLYKSDNINITRNFISNCKLGLSCSGSDNINLTDNTIINNDYGIGSSGDGGIIINNTISNNKDYGVSMGSSSQNYLFLNNTFINNGVNAFNDGTNNNWNNSKIGNYWDDYSGVDANYDGIGDTPYTFEGGVDYLPIWNIGPSSGSTGDDDDDDDDKKESVAISFGNYYLIFTLIGVVSVIIIIKKRKSIVK